MVAENAPGGRRAAEASATATKTKAATPVAVEAEGGDWVLSLAQAAEADIAQVGGKAKSLGVLVAAGFEVPPAVVLPTEVLDRVIDHGGLALARYALDEQMRYGELPSSEALAGFRQQLMGIAMPPWLEGELKGALGGALASDDITLAVRSSGTREDLEGASFAGQYETVLGVRGLPAVWQAILHCYASVWQPRVLEYASSRGGGALGLGMSVVVQAMVDADAAGVMFTINPMTGREEEVLIESVFGLGESLVSGKVTADRFVVAADGSGVRSETLAYQSHQVVQTEEGGTREEPLDEASGGARSLTTDQLLELGRLAGDIQEHYGQPMDVEWAFAGGTLYVLQARPVTQLLFAQELGEWTTADFRDGGVSSDVCSPFMWSLYQYAFENSMPVYFKDLRLVPRDRQATWARMFFARPYWNLGEVKRAMEPLPGYCEDDLHKDLGVEVRPGFAGKKTKTTARGIAGALPTLFALRKNYKQRIALNEQFHREFAAQVAPFDIAPAEVAALDRDSFTGQMKQLLTSLYLGTESGYFFTIYNTANSKLDLGPVFRKVNQLAGGTLDEPTLLSGLTDLSHLRPMKDLHRLAGEIARGERELDDQAVAEFGHRWRHRGRKELDIRVPRWVDDLAYVRELIEGAVMTYDPARDPDAMEAAHSASAKEMAARGERAARFRPLLRRSFRGKLARVRTYAWWREEMRDHSSFLYYLLRLWAIDAGRRLVAEGALGEQDDVWYLSFSDLLALLEGTLSVDQAQAQVASGRRLVRSFRNFKNPNEIGPHFGSGGADGATADAAASGAAEADGDALRGTACSGGRVTARARVVRTLEEASSLQRGDILVTPFTDPGWTPLFARIGGVVTETGGVLSHAAVIAREYGIPAVLAVSAATSRITDGAQITVDGFAGTVTRAKGEDL